MALQDKFQYLNDTKNAIRQSIINKGVPVSEADTFRSYSSKIDAIQQGGSEPTTGDYRVRFYDYDGTYEDKYCNLNGSVTPPDWSTKHQFLTFEEWQGDSYQNVTSNRNVKAVYYTTNGSTYLFLDTSIVTGSTISLYIYKFTTGTTTIKLRDKDGIVIDAKTSTTSISGNQNKTITLPLNGSSQPIYGKYIVEILSDGGNYRLGNSSTSTSVIGGSTQNIRDMLYKVYIGNLGSQIGTYAFYRTGLSSIMIPKGKNTSTSMCFMCYRLYAVVLPNETTIIAEYAFYYCHGLKFVLMPSGLTNLSSYAFQNCYNLHFILFPSTTAPSTVGGSIFTSISATARFYVPNSSVSAYKGELLEVPNYIYPISEID